MSKHAAHCELFDGQDICTCGANCEHFWVPIYYPAVPLGTPIPRRHIARCTECGKGQFDPLLPPSAKTGEA